MKKFTKHSLLIAVGAGLLLAASEAKATITATYTATQPASTTEWSHDFVLPQFNPALGTLESVYLAASESVVMTGTVQNTSTGPQSFSFTAGSMLVLTLPGSLGFMSPAPLANAQAYNLGSGETAPYGPVSVSDSVNYTYTLPADMAWFIGAGTITLPGFTLSQQEILGGGGNIEAILETLAGANVEVRYTYVPVPEPSTMIAGALLLLPFGLHGVRILRKNRQA